MSRPSAGRPVPAVVALAVACGVLVGSLAALRGQQAGAGGATPPKAIVPVAASTLGSHPDQFYGEHVSLSGTVEQILSKLTFSVDQDRTRSTGNEVLVLAPRMNAPVELNTYVTVIGEVVRFDPDEIAGKSKDYTIDAGPEAVAKYRGRPAILATSVINPGGVDVAMRLPPPMTAEEEAYQKIMRRVSAANTALRKALEGSNAELAAEQTTALKLAFSEIAEFWRTKGKADATSWAEDAGAIVETIEGAAAGGKWDQVKASAGTLGKTCQTCHTAYRERFDDGSFRIKLGSGGGGTDPAVTP